MLFAIFNIFFTVLIVVLLVRYFIEPYRFYGFGPILVGVVQVTERLIAPLRNFFPRQSLTLQDQIPLIAIVVVIVIRGFFIWIFGTGYSYTLPSPRFSNFALNLFIAMSISFTQGILLVGELLIALLFASLMISRRGLSLYGNAGYACFQEKTFAIFQYTQRIIKSANLVHLFLASSLAILIITAVLASLTSLSFLRGPAAFQRAMMLSTLEVVVSLLNFYWFLLLIAIIVSWVSADRFSTVVQIVQAMTEPYLSLFRRLMPWARIDFIDLSPIFAFLAVMLLITILQRVVFAILM